MTFIIAILSVPFLYATGIYSPKVVHHGRCIAQPGSFDALFCFLPSTQDTCLSCASQEELGRACTNPRRSGFDASRRPAGEPQHDGQACVRIARPLHRGAPIKAPHDGNRRTRKQQAFRYFSGGSSCAVVW
jgi:hypothetical protein